MVYLYWAGALVVIGPLLLGLPLLSRNGIYRTATFFAGINAGIVALSYFIQLLRWGEDPSYADQLHVFFTHALPSFYLASLIIGATIVAKFYLSTSTRVGGLFATLASIFGVYVLSGPMARALEVLSITVKEGFPSYEHLSDIAVYFFFLLTHSDFSLLILISVSTFIALNGAAAVMRLADDEAAVTKG